MHSRHESQQWVQNWDHLCFFAKPLIECTPKKALKASVTIPIQCTHSCNCDAIIACISWLVIITMKLRDAHAIKFSGMIISTCIAINCNTLDNKYIASRSNTSLHALCKQFAAITACIHYNKGLLVTLPNVASSSYDFACQASPDILHYM